MTLRTVRLRQEILHVRSRIYLQHVKWEYLSGLCADECWHGSGIRAITIFSFEDFLASASLEDNAVVVGISHLTMTRPLSIHRSLLAGQGRNMGPKQALEPALDLFIH